MCAAKAVIRGTEEALSDLRALGIGIHSCGGETADVGDLVRTISVDSSVVARVALADVIDNSRIEGMSVSALLIGP